MCLNKYCDPISDSILSAGLGDDEDEDESDPFIPQERVFSKYAAMVYTSNNQGRSFEEFKDAKYCPSCGEKVQFNFDIQTRHLYTFYLTQSQKKALNNCEFKELVNN